MKKYIAPVSKCIYLATDSTLLATSELHDEQSTSPLLSNHRSASSVIWGFDDEAIVEDEY